MTEVLSPLADFSAIPHDVLERARYAGTQVHLAAQLDDEDDLDESSLDKTWRPYLDAWRRFRDELGYTMVAVESPVYHPHWRYAGTPDRIAERYGMGAVVDIKRTHVIDPMVDLQTAAYQEAWNASESGIEVQDRLCVQLKADGTYQLRDCDRRGNRREDWRTFLACLQVWNWKQRNR